jgi:hypothetical protein
MCSQLQQSGSSHPVFPKSEWGRICMEKITNLLNTNVVKIMPKLEQISKRHQGLPRGMLTRKEIPSRRRCHIRHSVREEDWPWLLWSVNCWIPTEVPPLSFFQSGRWLGTFQPRGGERLQIYNQQAAERLHTLEGISPLAQAKANGRGPVPAALDKA